MAPWPIPWLYRLLWHPDNGEEDAVILAVPDSTRRFVSVLKLPESPKSGPPNGSGVVYLLATETLSERSALDAAELVRAAKPRVVVAQVSPGALTGLRSEDVKDRVPTNILGVIRACFLDSTERASFESRAGIEVLRIIFGTTCHGHILSAKSAAKEAQAAFLYLETPDLAGSKTEDVENSGSGGRQFGFLGVGIQRLSAVHSNFAGVSNQQPSFSSDCPTYAIPFYGLLVDLQNTYHQLPGMNQALQYARNLLFDVEQGRPIDQKELAEAQNFRLAVEGLRIALGTSDSRTEKNKRFKRKPLAQSFQEMSDEDKAHVLLAQAIQDQARTNGTVVALIDAASIAGIRKHWNATVSPEVLARARDCFVYSEFSGTEDDSNVEKAIVGSGAVAAVGIAALPWWAPATPFTKVLVLKAPPFLKLGFLQVKRNATVVLAKSMTPLFTPGKTFSALMKTATSAGKARAAAHSVVASAERATFSAIRTAFYCLMRKKQGMSSGSRPWLLLGSSVAAGAGILWCGDRLESAIESAPVAPTVARLGRGLENLENTARSLSEGNPKQKRWEDLYRSLHK